MKIFEPTYILASQSPRRKEIMERAGFKVKIMPAEIDEDDFPANLELNKIPVYLATKKAQVLLEKLGDEEIVIAADTVVILNEEILGKPEDEDHAFEILNKLSGAKHEVITGVCIASKGKTDFFQDSTFVYFRKFSDDEIKFYITHYKPFDKAGGYGVQDFLGMIGIERIEGDFYNVMGLPVRLVYDRLRVF